MMAGIDRRTAVAAFVFALLALVPVYAGLFKEPFYVTLFARVMVFAIAAVSLDLILGYGGMVSFGHAAYLGVGAYAVGILAHHGVVNGPLQWGIAVAASAATALAIGAISLRTSGMYFIMITLAFAQMLYFLAISLKAYGGDDGLPIAQRSDFGVVDLKNDVTLYYAIWFVLLVSLAAGRRLVGSRFGMVVRGSQANDRRMAAIGFPTYRYRLAAFVMSGTLCGLAGVLLATLTNFVSPSYMGWARSGELIVMVVLGGMGTLIGPVLGAAALLILEEVLASWTVHWMLILGPVLIAVVLTSRRGILRWLEGAGDGRR
jgi:branched-chain amino acid transport system permease protein